MTETTTGMVELEIKGDTHSAQYVVSDGTLTVQYGGERKSAEIGDLPPEEVARLLLSEIVRGV